MTPRRSFRAAAALVAMLALGAIVPGAALAGGGNSVAAHRCQMGGWQTLQDASGHAFASQSACVTYAASGGSLFHPVLSITDLGDLALLSGSYLYLDVETSGYHPNSLMTLQLSIATGPTVLWPTDGSGALTVLLEVWCPGFGFAPGDHVTGTITGTDAQGSTASDSFSATCSPLP